jgi:hypothetical protein
MLTITVGGEEVYDESADSFSVQGGTQLQLEHSLVSLSKWESEFEKPFLSSRVASLPKRSWVRSLHVGRRKSPGGISATSVRRQSQVDQ